MCINVPSEKPGTVEARTPPGSQEHLSQSPGHWEESGTQSPLLQQEYGNLNDVPLRSKERWRPALIFSSQGTSLHTSQKASACVCLVMCFLAFFLIPIVNANKSIVVLIIGRTQYKSFLVHVFLFCVVIWKGK